MSLIKLCFRCARYDIVGNISLKDIRYAVVAPVLCEQLIVRGKILRYLWLLYVLADKLEIRLDTAHLIVNKHFAQVLPASCRNEMPAVHGGLDLIEIVLLDLEVAYHRLMYALSVGIVLPGVIIRLHVYPLQPVPGNYIVFPHRLIVFRRISRRNNYPSVRHPVPSKYLVLQKLQHHWRKGLGNTVYLIKKKDPLLLPALLHHVVNRGYDLAHGIF